MPTVPAAYKNGSDYIDKIKFSGNSQGNEVMILATVQMTGKDAVM